MDAANQVRLVFAGELLPGFDVGEVKRQFGALFQMEGDRLDGVFSGKRTVLKSSVSREEAARYVSRLQRLGMRIVEEPLAPAKATTPLPTLPPLDAAVPAPPAPVARPPVAAPPPVPVTVPAAPKPAPVVLDIAPIEEQIVCPNCGERQPKRVLCRSCTTDMPRGIAAKKEDEDRLRAERLEAARARRGMKPSAGSGGWSPGQHDEHAPVLFALGIEGRLTRLTYITGQLVTWIAMLWVGLMALLHPNVVTVVLFVVAVIVITVWSTRVTVLRLHDFNASGWWAAMFMVPYIGMAVSLALLFIPGSREDNDYGGTPRPGSKMLVVVLLLVFSITVALGWRSTVRAFAKAMDQTEESETFDGVGSNGPGPTDQELRAYLPTVAAANGFRDEYWNQANHKAFAASADGAWGYGAGSGNPRQAVAKAMAHCEERRKPYTQACHLMNVNGQWVRER